MRLIFVVFSEISHQLLDGLQDASNKSGDPDLSCSSTICLKMQFVQYFGQNICKTDDILITISCTLRSVLIFNNLMANLVNIVPVYHLYASIVLISLSEMKTHRICTVCLIVCVYLYVHCVYECMDVFLSAVFCRFILIFLRKALWTAFIWGSIKQINAAELLFSAC